MLTKLAIQKLTAKHGQRVEIWDEKLPGFGVRASPTGTKTFVLMYYFAGRKRRMSLGRCSILSLKDARQMAIETLREVGRGIDPSASVAASVRQFGFGDVVDQFVEAHCKRHNRDNHARETERLLRARFVGAWGNRDVREIGKADIIKVLDGAVNAGTPSAANHALAAIRKLFSWASERGIVTANPCSGISRPAPVTTRERVLSMTEVEAIWRATETTSAPFAQIVRLLLLTAQRRGEVVGMHWSDIDWEARTWSIPASRTKSTRAQLVPLSPLALSVIGAIPRISDDVVFPSRGNGATTSGFSKMKRRLDASCQLFDWTLHDLRRTAATHMASFGVAPHVIERILNHTTGMLGGVAGIYNRFQYLPEMRAALELWAARVAELAESTSK